MLRHIKRKITPNARKPHTTNIKCKCYFLKSIGTRHPRLQLPRITHHVMNPDGVSFAQARSAYQSLNSGEKKTSPTRKPEAGTFSLHFSIPTHLFLKRNLQNPAAAPASNTQPYDISILPTTSPHVCYSLPDSPHFSYSAASTEKKQQQTMLRRTQHTHTKKIELNKQQARVQPNDSSPNGCMHQVRMGVKIHAIGLFRQPSPIIIVRGHDSPPHAPSATSSTRLGPHLAMIVKHKKDSITKNWRATPVEVAEGSHTHHHLSRCTKVLHQFPTAPF